MLIAQRMVQITFSYNILLRYRVFSYVCTFFHSNRNSLSSLIYLRADAKKFFMIAPRTKILCWMECQIIFVWNVLNGSSVQISGHRRATNYFWAEAMAQLVERSFPNLDVSGSDPDIGDFSDTLFPVKCTKDSNKEAENESVWKQTIYYFIRIDRRILKNNCDVV